VTIPVSKRDPRLTEKLRAEWGGILQWTVDGCLMWQRGGLCTPKAVSAATDDYMSSEDALGRWLDECTVKGPNNKAGSSALFYDWKRWCEATGEYAGSQKRFSQNLEARGFIANRTKTERVFMGLRLTLGGVVTDVTGQPNISVESFSKSKLSTGITSPPVTSVTLKRFPRVRERIQ
jgi:putative DNA primase/helicase